MDASRKSEPYGIWKSNNIVSLLAIVVVPNPTITPESPANQLIGFVSSVNVGGEIRTCGIEVYPSPL